MIKKVHFIWLGSDIPLVNKQIIDEWKLFLPDFEFYFWNDLNIINYQSRFLNQCLKKKAYAFASDIIRLKVVNEFGGFYLDTDMKLIKPLKMEINTSFQICEEAKERINWSYFYSIPNNPILIDSIQQYEEIYFDQFKPPVIPYFLGNIISKHQNNINILTTEYFYSLPMNKSPRLWTEFITPNSIGVHLWDFSWSQFKTRRSKWREISYRLKILAQDLLFENYPKYYFKINIIRIFRIIKSNSW